jgi:hypothetical protein
LLRAISDVLATGAIPVELQNQAAALARCIAGAAPLDDVRAMLAAAGFVDVDVKIAPRSAEIVGAWLPGIERFVASATIEARKPGARRSMTSCTTCGFVCSAGFRGFATRSDSPRGCFRSRAAPWQSTSALVRAFR